MRGCEGCTACCHYFAIKALGKAPLVACEHLADPIQGCNNCTIHGEHPKVCREYACMWSAGFGAPEDRPDLCGVMVDSATPVANALRALPVRAGAQDSEAGRLAVERISAETQTPVMVCEYPESRLQRVVGRGHG